VSRPRFARRVRGPRALTLAFAPRLIIQLSGACQISSSTKRASPRVEALPMVVVVVHNPTVPKTVVQSEEIWHLRKTCSNKHSLTSMRIITYINRQNLLGFLNMPG
jgi:hypothetical protein